MPCCADLRPTTSSLHKHSGQLTHRSAVCVRVTVRSARAGQLRKDELRGLMGDVTESFRKISDSVHVDEVKANLEGDNKFCCPISSALFQDPVVAADGRTYERSYIGNWIRRQLSSNFNDPDLRGKWQSPIMKTYHTSVEVHPATDMRSLMQDEIYKELIKMRVKQVST